MGETVPGMGEGSLNSYDILQAVKIRERIAATTGGRIVLFISSPPTRPPWLPMR